MNTQIFDRAILVIFLAAAAFTVLAHGAVDAWSVAVFEALLLLSLLLWAIKFVIDKKIEIKIPVTALPIAAFLLFGIVQSIALTGADGQISSLSLDAEATRSAVKILVFLLLSHIVAANIFNSSERIRTLMNFLTAFGLILAVFGLIQYFTWNGKFYWLFPVEIDTKGVVGPFVNHNHFAGYLELIIPLPVALILTGAVGQARFLYGFAAVMMAVAILASLSRGGIIGLTAGILFVAAAGASWSIRRKKSLEHRLENDAEAARVGTFQSIFRSLAVVALITCAVAAGTIWLGSDPLVERISKNSVVGDDEKAETFEDSRGWIWKNSLKMFEANPVCGVGLGAFETLYPRYSDRYGGSRVIDRAHNDYLQILTDTGSIGGAVGIWFLLTVFLIMRGGLKSLEPFQSGVVIGVSASIVSMLVHSIFDFNLQIPSTSLLFLTLTAVLAAAAAFKDEAGSDARLKNLRR